MSAIAQILNQGFQHHQRGNWQQAEDLYRQVLTLEPHHPDALHLLGLLAHQLGDPETALANLSQAVRVSPHQPIYYNSLGEAYRAIGQFNEAVNCYTQALRYNYDYAEAHFNLANTLQRLGQVQAAIASYRQVIALKPDLAPAHHNLGLLLKQQGQFETAIAAYQQALTLQPDYPLALNSLGVMLGELGQKEEAIALLNRAIELDSTLAEAHLNLGNLLKGQSKGVALAPAREDAVPAVDPSQQALQQYQAALALKPDWAEAYFTLGNFYKDQGQTEIALTQYQKALELQPHYPEAFWNQQLLLPILYTSVDEIRHWRSRFTQGLQTLIATVALRTPAECQQAIAGLGSVTNFYLQYQGLADRDLQEQYGKLVQAVMQANYPQWSRPIQRQVSQRNIRVGFVSHFFREHTVGKLFLGWLQLLSRDDFQVFCYYLGQQQDEWTAQFQQASDRFVASFNQFATTAEFIYRDRLDVLIFTDIGMNAESYKLAGLRLAPVQCVAWGHPITSGIPTVDYFISSAAMEPPHAEADYTESLVQLPGIGISYTPPRLPESRKSRQDLGLPAEGILYLSCQSLYKYLPQYDFIFPEIAQQIPLARFVFLASPTQGDFVTEQFRGRLAQAFSKFGLDSRHYCTFLPRLDWQDYLQVNLQSDIFLDTLDWSGGNTTLEALACGLPVVTYPGQFMRGRHAYAMLNVLGLTDTIATSPSHYVEIAVRLGRDPDWRRAIATQIHNNAQVLFADQACIHALEDFLKQAVTTPAC